MLEKASCGLGITEFTFRLHCLTILKSLLEGGYLKSTNEDATCVAAYHTSSWIKTWKAEQINWE